MYYAARLPYPTTVLCSELNMRITFRWKWMWSRIADYFGLPAADYPALISFHRLRSRWITTKQYVWCPHGTQMQISVAHRSCHGHVEKPSHGLHCLSRERSGFFRRVRQTTCDALDTLGCSKLIAEWLPSSKKYSDCSMLTWAKLKLL